MPAVRYPSERIGFIHINAARRVLGFQFENQAPRGYVTCELVLNMKQNVISVLAVTLLAWAAGFGCASQQNTTRTDSPNSPERIQGTVTGSYIPRDINRSGPVTDGQ